MTGSIRSKLNRDRRPPAGGRSTTGPAWQLKQRELADARVAGGADTLLLGWNTLRVYTAGRRTGYTRATH